MLKFNLHVSSTFSYPLRRQKAHFAICHVAKIVIKVANESSCIVFWLTPNWVHHLCIGMTPLNYESKRWNIIRAFNYFDDPMPKESACNKINYPPSKLKQLRMTIIFYFPIVLDHRRKWLDYYYSNKNLHHKNRFSTRSVLFALPE